MQPDTHSLYIHWPFCPYKCHFCPFVALAGHDQYMSKYHDSLKKELISFALEQPKQRLDTIFLGGGTPSTYPVPLLLDTFGTLKEMFFIENAEITLEVNPGTASDEQVRMWRMMGINRLSIGVQSLKDSVLKSLNRHQSVSDVISLIGNASGLFENISLDLILGLPDVSQDEWKEIIAKVVTWPIKHISMYFLTIHENTPLYFQIQRKQVSLPADDAIIDLYYWTVDYLAAHGFAQYELSNFAQPGYESRHNSIYWQRKPYKGIGLGACSFDGTIRTQNEKNLMKYMQLVDAGASPVVFSENLNSEQINLEVLMLGLRRREGVEFAHIEANVPTEKLSSWHEKINELIQHNFLTKKDGKLFLTGRGLLLENQIIVQIAQG